MYDRHEEDEQKASMNGNRRIVKKWWSSLQSTRSTEWWNPVKKAISGAMSDTLTWDLSNKVKDRCGYDQIHGPCYKSFDRFLGLGMGQIGIVSYFLGLRVRLSSGPVTYALSWKPCQGDSLNLPDHRIHKDGDGDASFQLKSDSLPHAHAQTTKTFYKHQDSRIMKAQELKTKTSAQTLIYKIFLQRYQVYQGRLLASFQDDAKYEHVGQDTRSQGGKDDQDKQGKDLKISDIKTKSKDNDKGSRSKITKHEGTSLQRRQRQRSQELNDKSNLIDLTKECHNELTSGEIVSLKILSRTRKFVHYIRSRSLN
ncbi:hypothetical protein Tco_0646814 [Tanacetum coccineum]